MANLGVTNITEAILWGLYHGLELAWQAGCRRLIAKMDSHIAVELMGKEISRTHPLSNLIGCYKDLLTRDWIVIFKHTFREGNRVVDKLTNFCNSLSLGHHILS